MRYCSVNMCVCVSVFVVSVCVVWGQEASSYIYLWRGSVLAELVSIALQYLSLKKENENKGEKQTLPPICFPVKKGGGDLTHTEGGGEGWEGHMTWRDR